MKITPNEEDRALAKKTYTEFHQKPGSKHIASEFALAGLSALLRELKPTSVFELGAGIGTITHFLWSHPVSIKRIVSMENNAFCLQELAKNLPAEAQEEIQIVHEVEDVPPEEAKFDLVLLDGGLAEGREKPFRFAEKGTVLYFEGVQQQNRDAMDHALAKSGLFCRLTNNRPKGRRPLTMRLQDRRFLGLRVPKIRVFHKVKGCWIGVVEQLAERA